MKYNERRNISNELYEAVAYLNSARQKVSQYKLQLEQAEKANFSCGNQL